MRPPGNSAARWEARSRRARELAGQVPAAAQMLEFYAQIADFQARVAASLETAPGTEIAQGPLRFDLSAALACLAEFLPFVREAGPTALAAGAEELMASGREVWARLLTTYWETGGKDMDNGTPATLFFARAVLQPFAATAASARPAASVPANTRLCPHCGGRPVVGVLRKEALGAKRSLVCSLCLTEWEYQRVLCPNCGEDGFESLPVFTAEKIGHMRVEACESCKTFIPTADLTKHGLAIPDVDELAAVALVLWAQEAGFTRLQPNLMGL